MLWNLLYDKGYHFKTFLRNFVTMLQSVMQYHSCFMIVLHTFSSKERDLRHWIQFVSLITNPPIEKGKNRKQLSLLEMEVVWRVDYLPINTSVLIALWLFPFSLSFFQLFLLLFFLPHSWFPSTYFLVWFISWFHTLELFVVSNVM